MIRYTVACSIPWLLAACSQLSGSKPEPGSETASANDGGKQVEAADPIARFAIDAPEGASSRVMRDNSTVFVTVGPYYRSAAGDRCRRVTLRAARGGSHVNAVCRQGETWTTVVNY